MTPLGRVGRLPTSRTLLRYSHVPTADGSPGITSAPTAAWP